MRLATVIDKALGECRTYLPVPAYQQPTDESWVHADAEQLASVLIHLIRNAQDAATPGGHVTLRLKQTAGQAALDIVDDGGGMDAEFIRQRLFEPFFTTKGSRGMGIGAYQAREYVRLLGGTLNVDSTPGHGTVFTIVLPLVEPVVADVAATKLMVPS